MRKDEPSGWWVSQDTDVYGVRLLLVAVLLWCISGGLQISLMMIIRYRLLCLSDRVSDRVSASNNPACAFLSSQCLIVYSERREESCKVH